MKKAAGEIMFYNLLGISGLLFALGCLFIYILELILYALGFIGLLSVAVGSLGWRFIKKRLAI